MKHKMLFLALAGGVICSFCHLIFSVDLYRDSANVYAFMARALAEGNYADAFHANIPHLNVCCSYPFSLLGMAPGKALSLVSCLFYLGAIFYLFFLMREFLPEKLAGFGALLFAFAPKVIRFFCTPLIDSGKCFFLTAALYYGYKLIKSRFSSPGNAAGFGAALGLLSLARSEAIANAGIIGICVGIFCIIEVVRSKKFMPLVLMISAGAITMIFLASRIVLMGIFCGKWCYDERISAGLAKIFPQISVSAPATAANSVPVKVFNSSWSHLAEQNARGSYEVYLLFTVIGVIILLLALYWKNAPALFPDKKVPDFIKWNNYYWVFLIVVASNMLIFKAAKILAFRYFLLNIPVLMVFTLIGLYWVWQQITRRVPHKAVILVVALVLLFQAANGLARCFDRKHRIDYHTGLYLKQNLPPGKAVPVGKAAGVWYYSGLERALPVEAPPVDLATFNDFKYVICPSKDRQINIFENRQDLEEIKIPVKSTVRVFEKVR